MSLIHERFGFGRQAAASEGLGGQIDSRELSGGVEANLQVGVGAVELRDPPRVPRRPVEGGVVDGAHRARLGEAELEGQPQRRARRVVVPPVSRIPIF